MDVNWIKRNEESKQFFNPLDKDFEIEYLGDDNIPVKYVIPGVQISTFPAYLADFFIKHLVDEVANERDLSLIGEKERNEILKEIMI